MKTYKQFNEEVENLDELWGALAAAAKLGKGIKGALGAAKAAKAAGAASKAAKTVKAANTTSRTVQSGNTVAKGSKMRGNPRLKGKPPSGRRPSGAKPDGPNQSANPNIRRKMQGGANKFAKRKALDLGNYIKDKAISSVRAGLRPNVGTANSTTGNAPEVVVK